MSVRVLRVPTEGGQLQVQVQGSGEPVLLVHGLFCSMYCWRHVAERLAERYTVYLVDLLGFGDSDMPADADYSQSAQARRLHQVVEFLHLENVRLVGHSMGGEISVLAVLQNPKPFAQLVLVSADGFRPPFTRSQRFVLSGLWMELYVRRKFQEKGFREAIAGVVNDPSVFTQDVVDEYLKPYKRKEFPRAMRRLALHREGGFAPEACRDMQVPTLLLWGADDPVVPKRVGDKYAAMIPANDYVVKERMGHMPMEEDPEWTAEQMLAFFARGSSQE